MYISREIEHAIDFMLTQGKVVLLTGARQVGKTTVLKEHLGSSYNYISLEDPTIYMQATTDAILLFDTYETPLIIDEIQRIPELFSSVKHVVDQSNEKGQIVLTGSQTYHLMKGVSESLAGRIRILEMTGLSLREIIHSSKRSIPYLPQKIERDEIRSRVTSDELWEIIHRGSKPELQNNQVDWDSYYTDYVRTYLERDVRDLIAVQDEMKFYSFMVACAARTGQLLNASDIGNAIDVDHKTVKAWLSVLQASGTVRLLQPFWQNIEKRITKTPKLYFMDTGLACHLTRWTTPQQLRTGAVAGHMFETFAVGEVLKSFLNSGSTVRDVWFYRDNKKKEIDLIIQDGRTLHPVEIKLGMQVGLGAIKNFSVLENMTDYEVGFGHVICQTKEPYMISREVQAVPLWAI